MNSPCGVLLLSAFLMTSPFACLQKSRGEFPSVRATTLRGLIIAFVQESAPAKLSQTFAQSATPTPTPTPSPSSKPKAPKGPIDPDTPAGHAQNIPKFDLLPSTHAYRVVLALGDSKTQGTLETAIKNVHHTWVATNTLETPEFYFTDTSTIEKETLALQNQKGQFQDTGLNFTGKELKDNFEFSIINGAASGFLDQNGKQTQVFVPVDGAVFPDLTTTPSIIGVLPLDVGYSVSFRTFNVQQQKEIYFKLRVAGQESVTVPAGVFDTYRVEIFPLEGPGALEVFWISKADHVPVKIETKLDQLSATVIAELVK